MSRAVVSIFVGLALIVVLVVGATNGFGSTSARQFSLAQPPPPEQQRMPARTHPLPPELEFLRTLPAEQQFDSVVGAQATVLDPQGQAIVVNAIPGQVTALTANSVTVDLNGPAQASTFNVTQDTLVSGIARRGSLTVFNPGDRVVVFTIGDSPNASAIVEARFAMGMMDHYRMMDGRSAEPAPAAATPATGG